MKSIASILLLALFFITSKGQTIENDHSMKIIEQAEKMAQLLLDKDFSAFCKYTYPKIIEMMGGKQKMIEIMEKGSKEMLSEGTDFLKITFGNPSKLINTGNELQCTLPQTIEMKVPNGRLVTKSTLIAISKDGGKNWYFVDTAENDIQTMKKSLPNLSGKLIIPEKTRPIFYSE